MRHVRICVQALVMIFHPRPTTSPAPAPTTTTPTPTSVTATTAAVKAATAAVAATATAVDADVAMEAAAIAPSARCAASLGMRHYAAVNASIMHTRPTTTTSRQATAAGIMPATMLATEAIIMAMVAITMAVALTLAATTVAIEAAHRVVTPIGTWTRGPRITSPPSSTV